MTDQPSRLRRAAIPLLIYVVTLGAYLGASGSRLVKPSGDNHYVYLADSLLEGRLSLEGAPPHQNDWALVTELTLADGRVLRGAYLRVGGTEDRFKTTHGERIVIPPGQITSRRDVYYVSFPWFPSILMLPFVAIWGMAFNDVIFTVMVAAFNPVLIFFILRRLNTLGLSERSLADNLWLTGMFAFGTVHFYSSVLGQVWYTAHVVGVTLGCLYLLASLEGRHPLLAGTCAGLAFVTRPPITFSFPIAVGEILRRHVAPPAEGETAPTYGTVKFRVWLRSVLSRLSYKKAIVHLVMLALPVGGIAGLAMFFNYRRFDNPTEFGHYYLNVRWTARIQRWGLFNYHFLPRNLAVAFTLLPRILAKPPWVRISWHGLSMFFTTPLLALLVRGAPRRSPIAPWLYLSCLIPMIFHLFYQNSGWVQFGYRFSLDYMVYLVALLAIGGYRLGWVARILIMWGVAVNTFGAITFGRYWDFYWDGMFPVP